MDVKSLRLFCEGRSSGFDGFRRPESLLDQGLENVFGRRAVRQIQERLIGLPGGALQRGLRNPGLALGYAVEVRLPVVWHEFRYVLVFANKDLRNFLLESSNARWLRAGHNFNFDAGPRKSFQLCLLDIVDIMQTLSLDDEPLPRQLDVRAPDTGIEGPGPWSSAFNEAAVGGIAYSPTTVECALISWPL